MCDANWRKASVKSERLANFSFTNLRLPLPNIILTIDQLNNMINHHLKIVTHVIFMVITLFS